MQPIKLILIEKHDIFLEGITQCLEKWKDLQVIAQPIEGIKAKKLVNRYTPSLIVTGLSVPVIHGLELITSLTESSPEIKFLIMAESGKKASLKMAIELGAKVYISKNVSVMDLIKAIRLVNCGYSHLDPSFLELQSDSKFNAINKENYERISPGKWKLTVQEKKILRLIMKGKTSNEIGQKLNISKRTVQNHRLNIMKKFQVKNLVDLVIFSLGNQYLYD